MKIYIVEDEEAIRMELITLLEKYGYSCESCSAFKNITGQILAAEPELILLDINLPFQDGFTVCREVRKSSDVPIIVLTSRNTDFDELMSLNIGADDFIAKPYNAQVLIARIQKVIKRTYEVQNNSILIHKGLTINLLKATMCCGESEVELTKNECIRGWENS